MEERRQHKRRAAKAIIKFAVIRNELSGILSSDTAEAEVFDISETGFGLLTQDSLKPGHLIKVMEKDSNLQLSDTGVVMWTTESAEGFKAGIKFI